MVKLAYGLLALPLLGACAARERLPGESDVACISRLYEPPARVASFAVADGACVGNRPADLTGSRLYQAYAQSQGIPFTARDTPGTRDPLKVTGSLIAY
jgi:hypothetical protein